MADVSLMAVPSQPQDGTTCANCGAEVVADQRYCLSCGHPVSPVRLGVPRRAPGPGHPPGAPVVGARHAGGHPGRLRPPSPSAGWAAGCAATAALFGLLSVLLLCLIAGLLARPLGLRWRQGPNSPTVKIEGLGGARPSAPAGSTTTPSTTTPAKPSAGARPQGQEGTAGSGQGSRQRNEGRKSPARRRRKRSPTRNSRNSSTSTGKKHPEEINAKGAEPIETS